MSEYGSYPLPMSPEICSGVVDMDVTATVVKSVSHPGHCGFTLVMEEWEHSHRPRTGGAGATSHLLCRLGD